MAHTVEQCKHCAYFIEENDVYDPVPGLTYCAYVHLDDGETEHDHDAEPSGVVKTLSEWKREHPELFPYKGERNKKYQERRKREFGGVVSD